MSPPAAGGGLSPPIAFGTEGVVFQFGVWRFCRQTIGIDILSIWTGSHPVKAVELVGSSNGYWRLLKDGQGLGVYGYGQVEKIALAAKPWEAPLSGSVVPVGPLTYRHEGDGRATDVTLTAEGEILIALANGASVRLSRDSNVITFTRPNGKVEVY